MQIAARGYRVRFVNHNDMLADGVFATVAEAIAVAKRTGFSAAIDSEEGGCVAGWDAIGGVRFYSNEARAEFYARGGAR